MEIVPDKTFPQQNPCYQCTQKLYLIEKYQNLITLLKREVDRSKSSTIKKNSSGDITTRNASFNDRKLIGAFNLSIVLILHQQKLKISVFYQIKLPSILQKQRVTAYLFGKLQKILTNMQCKSLNELKLGTFQNKLQNVLSSENQIDKKILGIDEIKSISERTKSCDRSDEGLNGPIIRKSKFSQPQNFIIVDHQNYKSLTCVHQDLICSPTQYHSKTLKRGTVGSYSKKPFSNNPIKNLYKNLFTLEQQKLAFQIKITELQRDMQQALGLQINQNRKKTESLEMLAEEMAQKNQIIAELQQKVAMIQEKYQHETNGVLQDQLTQYKKEVQKLQKTNIRLDNQLRKTKDKLIKAQSILKQLQKEKLQLHQMNQKYKQELFQREQRIYEVKFRHINFLRCCKKIEKTLRLLKHHQKNYSKHSKAQNNQEISQYTEEKNSLQQFYKLELVFVYLYKIEDESYDFAQHVHLFDQEQLEVLKGLKLKFIQTRNKQQKKDNLMENILCTEFRMEQTYVNIYRRGQQNSRQNFHLENIYCHHNLVDESIFEILDDYNKYSQVESITTKTQRLDTQNLTMKLLQMEIEKNKQIQKISEIKEKNMYIRNIILNFMKSLQLRQNAFKNQALSILELIFEVFEYSEEEKRLMFSNTLQTKEKQLFGFI